MKNPVLHEMALQALGTMTEFYGGQNFKRYSQDDLMFHWCKV